MNKLNTSEVQNSIKTYGERQAKFGVLNREKYVQL